MKKLWNIEKIVKKGDYLYAVVKNHPKAIEFGYVLHHRIVMENYLGRVLEDDEIVHHINGNKKDNRIENLQILKDTDHDSYHGFLHGTRMVVLKCPYCEKIFEKQYNNSYLGKKGNWSCCCRSCNGKLSREIQLNGINRALKIKLNENLVKEYILFRKENN